MHKHVRIRKQAERDTFKVLAKLDVKMVWNQMALELEYQTSKKVDWNYRTLKAMQSIQ